MRGRSIDRHLRAADRALHTPVTTISLGNRRRFIKRVREAVKDAVDEAVRTRKIADVDRADTVTIPGSDIHEPSFRNARQGGRREHVLPGNKSYRPGDRIDKPPERDGKGPGGTPDGETDDDFLFVLSRDEFLDLFFEDLHLPDLVKRSLKRIEASKPKRSGLSVTGPPANLSVKRTIQNAIGRRTALRRPGAEEVRRVRARIADLEAETHRDEAARRELAQLSLRLDQLLKWQKRVPFLDPLDLRFKHYEKRPEPSANAVMFCLMDVSASMGEREKDLAKRFFALLHLFLKRCYDKVELVFIRHTHEAKAVDEETFFYSRESGGTVVSTALAEMQRVVAKHYPPADWNIYAAQASDGENYSGDSARCVEILRSGLMQNCQYFAYVEIIDPDEAHILKSPDNGTELWRAYMQVADDWPNFAVKRIAEPADIYPVFRELFSAHPEISDA